MSAPELLRIGILQSLSSRRVSKLSRSFRRAHPHVEIEVMDGSSDRLSEWLGDRRRDTMLSIRDGDTAKLASRVQFEKPNSLAVREAHHLALKPFVELSDLDNEASIVRTGADRFQEGANALVARRIEIESLRLTLVERPPRRRSPGVHQLCRKPRLDAMTKRPCREHDALTVYTGPLPDRSLWRRPRFQASSKTAARNAVARPPQSRSVA